jgi:hypothetical protein
MRAVMAGFDTRLYAFRAVTLNLPSMSIVTLSK